MFYNSSGYGYAPVYAALSDDKTSAWGLVIEKAWAKVLGNYLKTDGGYLTTAIRALTGVPTFDYSITSQSFDPVVVFALLSAADQSNYIMALGTSSGSDKTNNACGLAFGHAYTLLSAFTLLDKTLPTTDAAYNQSMIMVRNPWGLDNAYNLTW